MISDSKLFKNWGLHKQILDLLVAPVKKIIPTAPLPRHVPPIKKWQHDIFIRCIRGLSLNGGNYPPPQKKTKHQPTRHCTQLPTNSIYALLRREANGGTNFIRVCLCICLFVSALTFEWFHFSSPNFQRIFI